VGVPLQTGATGQCLVGNSCVADAAVSLAQAAPVDASNTVSPTDALLPSIAPIASKPQGQTYGRWAVEWQQWLYGIPAAVNPLTDSTGAFCDQRQVGEVWFLVGSTSTTPVSRNCHIPAGKSLFFPLINTGYGAFLNDPADTRTEAYVRAAGSCSLPASINVKIDGVKVRNPNRYFTGSSGSQSPFFNIQLSPNNLYGFDETVVPELVFSPSAEQGYYLFVLPLTTGSHTIHWTASGCTPGNSLDITYNLTVS
jgi:hypothetical protein